PRLGIAGRDEQDDIVQGIVLMRRGQQSLPTIRRVEAEVEKINTSGILPPGVQIERIYDRSDLINLTTNTVLFNLVFGMILVFSFSGFFWEICAAPSLCHRPFPSPSSSPSASWSCVENPPISCRWALSISVHRRCHRYHGGKHLSTPCGRR